MAVEEIDRRRRGRRRHRRGRGARRCARIPMPTASSSSTSTPATARRCRSAAAPSTWPSATSCRWPRSAPSMPDGMEIERRKLRGEWSNGMLCSARELGLGDDHDGILILAAGPRRSARRCATPSASSSDVRLRPRHHPQPARRLVRTAASPATWPPACGVPFTRPGADRSTPAGPRASSTPVEHRRRPTCAAGSRPPCSPACRSARRRRWMAERLTRAGMRPINNVVDVSNYVMLELGQPNHPYDLAELPGRRPSGCAGPAPGETMVTLDDVERTLDGRRPPDLRRRTTPPIGIAGVMGGASSEIDDAHHRRWRSRWRGSSPMTVARTAARLGLRSEASARFERGVRPRGDRRRHRPLRRAAARDQPGRARWRRAPSTREATCRRRLAVRVRTDRVNALLGTELDRRPTSPRCSTRSASPPARRRTPASRTVADPLVAARLQRPRSTSSRRSPATTATSASAEPVPASAHPGSPHARCSTIGGCVRQVLVGLGSRRGHADAAPRVPATSPRAGLPEDAIALDQPAGRRGERAAARRCGPGC